MRMLPIPSADVTHALICAIRPQLATTNPEQIAAATPLQLGLDEFDTIELLAGFADLFDVGTFPAMADEELQIAEIMNAFIAQSLSETII
jgi:hypothetical protein